MFGKTICWSISSKKDPRWNCDGCVSNWAATAGLPPDAEKIIKEKEKELGSRPDDLVYHCAKD